MRKTIKIIVTIIVVFLLLAGIICGLGFLKMQRDKKDFHSMDITNGDTKEQVSISEEIDKKEEVTEEISTETISTEGLKGGVNEILVEFSEVDQVEYMILAELCKPYETDSPEQAHIVKFDACDIDNDGERELLLLINHKNTDYYYAATYYTFDRNDKIYSIDSIPCSEVLVQIQMNSKKNYAYMCIDFSLDITDILYLKWGRNGWHTVGEFVKNGSNLTQCIWNKKEISESKWNKKIHDLHLKDIENNLSSMQVIQTEALPETVVDTLDKSLDGFVDSKYILKDNTKKDVYYIVLDHYKLQSFEKMADSVLGCADELPINLIPDQRKNKNYDYDLVVKVQPSDTGSKISCSFFDKSFKIENASYKDGIFIETDEESYLYDFSGDILKFVNSLTSSDTEITIQRN